MQSSRFAPYNEASPIVTDVSILQSVLDHSVDALILLSHDRHVLYMNRAATHLVGEETLAVHCGTLLHCHDGNRASLQHEGCYGQCVLNSQHPLTNVEMNITGADGTAVPVEVSYSYIPVPDSEPYLLMSMRDVTDKKVAERERRQKEELRYTLQERQRLARDLHDGAVQDIAFVNMQLKMILEDLQHGCRPTPEELEKISQVLDTGYNQLRTAIHDLSSGMSGNLKHQLEQSVLRFRGRSNGTEITLHCNTFPSNFEDSFVHQVTKIVQEALTNIRKHAQATRASVSVQYLEQTKALVVDICDNGVGFSKSDEHRAGHYGMKTMCERCELLGGSIKLESHPSEGTQIHVEVPLFGRSD